MPPLAQWDLDPYLVELAQDGLTVIPPFLVSALAPEHTNLHERLERALARLMNEERAVERRVDHGVLVIEVHDLIGADPVFEAAVSHPAVVAIAASRLGDGFQQRSCAPVVSAMQRTDRIQLHCDGGEAMLSCVWIVTRYGEVSGSLCYVPGSHRLSRMPKSGEGVDELVPVEAEPGSLLAFDGFLWHGTWHRSTPGERLGVHCLFKGALRFA